MQEPKGEPSSCVGGLENFLEEVTSALSLERQKRMGMSRGVRLSVQRWLEVREDIICLREIEELQCENSVAHQGR